MKRKAEQASEPFNKLVCNLVGDLSWEAKFKLLVDKTSPKKTVQRARVVSRVHPHAPDNLETLVLPPAYIWTNNNEPFLLLDSEYDMVHRRTLLFGTVDCIDLLGKADHGLFEYGYRLLLVYALLPRKTQHHNTTLFQELDAFGVEPQSVMCDFERSLFQVAQAAWPSTTIRFASFTIVRLF